MIARAAASVTVTGHNNRVVYDGEEHTVSGYDVDISNPLYTETDFVFSGTAEAKRTDVGTTSMGLSESQFANSNTNYDVTFSVYDGYQEIVEKNVTLPAVELEYDSVTYDGSEKKPSVSVKDGEKVIPESEYTVSYSNNINAGTATVTVTDKDGGNYTVSGSKTFEITSDRVMNRCQTLRRDYSSRTRRSSQSLMSSKRRSKTSGPTTTGTQNGSRTSSSRRAKR